MTSLPLETNMEAHIINKLNIMTFVQEYTIYFHQGFQLFVSFRAFGILSGYKSVYSFTKTHNIVFIMCCATNQYKCISSGGSRIFQMGGALFCRKWGGAHPVFR